MIESTETSAKEPKSSSASEKAEVAAAALPTGPIVLFDGVCNFCNGAIQFLVDHERSPDLQFAPLQSQVAADLLEEAFGAERAKLLREGTTGNGDPDTIIFLEGGDSGGDSRGDSRGDSSKKSRRGYTHSAAGLKIAQHLRAPWRWGIALIVIPRPIRDFLYRFIAKNRYRWFGRSETCRVPAPELRKRFLAKA